MNGLNIFLEISRMHEVIMDTESKPRLTLLLGNVKF